MSAESESAVLKRAFQALELQERFGEGERFEDETNGLRILSSARAKYFNRRLGFPDAIWSFSIGCFLPFWPKEDEEEDNGPEIRRHFLVGVKEGEGYNLLVSQSTGRPIGLAWPGFFDRAHGLLDLGAPSHVQNRFRQITSEYMVRRYGPPPRLTYRHLARMVGVDRLLETIE